MTKERKQQILQAALEKERTVAVSTLDAMARAQHSGNIDPAAWAAQQITALQERLQYLADVDQLISNVQNPETAPAA
jgi:hypothetical protein